MPRGGIFEPKQRLVYFIARDQVQHLCRMFRAATGKACMRAGDPAQQGLAVCGVVIRETGHGVMDTKIVFKCRKPEDFETRKWPISIEWPRAGGGWTAKSIRWLHMVVCLRCQKQGHKKWQCTHTQSQAKGQDKDQAKGQAKGKGAQAKGRAGAKGGKGKDQSDGQAKPARKRNRTDKKTGCKFYNNFTPFECESGDSCPFAHIEAKAAEAARRQAAESDTRAATASDAQRTPPHWGERDSMTQGGAETTTLTAGAGSSAAHDGLPAEITDLGSDYTGKGLSAHRCGTHTRTGPDTSQVAPND